MNIFKSTYFLPIAILCLFIIAGCSLPGAPTTGGDVNPMVSAVDQCIVWGSRTSPQVTYTTIANGATDVFVNTKVGVFFTKEMNPRTINESTFVLFREGNRHEQWKRFVKGKVTYNGLGAVFAPYYALEPNTAYTAIIKSWVRDLTGNSMARDYVWSWTTGAGTDTTGPSVIHTNNPDGATDVFINTKIIATFNKAMDPSTISASTFTLMQGTTPVTGKVTYLGLSLIFTPAGNLAPNTKYTATITTGIKDLAGNSLPGNYVWSWTTGSDASTATPYIISTASTTVSAIFSEAMDPLTITTLTFLLKQGTRSVAGTVIYNDQSLTANFIPAVNLTPNTTYTATITTGVKSVTGVPMASNKVWNFTTSPSAGIAPVNLGSAVNFTILAGSTITNTGNTIVNGDIGLSPGTAVTGFPPGILNGTFYLADSIAAAAKLDLTTAYNDAAGRTGAITVSSVLGGTMLPGVYKSSAGTFSIAGTLTLNAQGNADAVFIFQAATTLITASNSNIILTGGAQAKNVFWQVGSSATIGTNSIFKGIILAQASITVTTGATIEGKALTQTAAVTLDTNAISQ